jgi:UTP--glucose-1-phosphate uridylyltransferase
MKNQVTKAVIPVAGLGTRMLPATKAIPKELLPIVDKPLIQYVVHEAIAAGITEIVLVTHASKNAIENHFDTTFELEAQLVKRVKRQLLDEVQSILPEGVLIVSVRQAEAKGLGHAIQCAQQIVGNEPFAVLLPDVLVDEYLSDLKTENLAAMVNRFNQTEISQIMVEPVPWERVDQYGVVDCRGHELELGGTAQIVEMVEKPDVDAAPSNMAVVGRYVLSAATWDKLATTLPGAGDEIQLTDAIASVMADEPVEAYHIIGKSHDCGNKLGYLKATVEYALRHAEVADDFSNYLVKIAAKNAVQSVGDC